MAECILVAAVFAAGLALRLAAPAHLSVEHFDEGVYGSNIWFGDTGTGYPMRHLYAPPLVPALAEWSIVGFGVSRPGPILINIIAGSLTVLLVWWVARRFFGPVAGVSAATLAAFSDFHILFSRTLLTDPLLCLWMLLAVGLAWEGLRLGSWKWSLAAGLATALAWWTKYNGWLPLAIVGAGLSAWLIAERVVLGNGTMRSALRFCTLWLVMAVVAAAAWSPVLYGLKDLGGYAAVQANHRGYLVGIGGWLDSLARQAAAHAHLNGLAGCASLLATFWLCPLVLAPASCRFTWKPKSPADVPNTATGSNASAAGSNRRLWIRLIVSLAAIGVALTYAATFVLAACAVAGILLELRAGLKRRAASSPDAEAAGHRTLAAWLVAAWFVGLFLATPLYHPYARLTLPWLVACWLGTAALIGRLVPAVADGCRSEAATPADAPACPTCRWDAIRPLIVPLVMVCAFLAMVGSLPPERFAEATLAPWQDRTGLERVARQIAAEVGSRQKDAPAASGPPIVYVYAQPALVYHLRAQGIVAIPLRRRSFVASRSPDVSRGEYFVAALADSGETSRIPNTDAAPASAEGVRAYSYTPSEVVLLDRFHPAQLGTGSDARTDVIVLNRLR